MLNYSPSIHLIDYLKEKTAEGIFTLYGIELSKEKIAVNITKTDHDGDFTILLFEFTKTLKTSPEALGNSLGAWFLSIPDSIFKSFNLIKGFLNIAIKDSFWLNFLAHHHLQTDYGKALPTGNTIMVEYSSPNTNKPLHLGHLRNNFLGESIAAMLAFRGNKVVRTCVVNDRGVHICKSMLAWQLFGNETTPETEKMKGDHFVGKYYVAYNDALKQEIETLIKEKKCAPKEAEKESQLQQAVQKMLIQWEQEDTDTRNLWKKMNQWVYAGFEETYKKIGTHFDATYYESATYLLGKDWVKKGVETGVFKAKEDGSIWIDLTADGLDEKIVQRSDGTSVYITQDIGLADKRNQEWNADKAIYVIGDEQNYHMKVLKLICQKLGVSGADGIYHLSYGMVELPDGKMKSREGTVVDADDIIETVVQIAAEKTTALGKTEHFSEEDLQVLYETIGIGALKFFLLRVDPKKKIIFNPQETIDFHGYTAPFIQYTYARIQSVLDKIKTIDTQLSTPTNGSALAPIEKDLIKQLHLFPYQIQEAVIALDPSKLTMYLFNLCQLFNSFYAQYRIVNAPEKTQQILRKQMVSLAAIVIKNGMKVLKINVPNRM